MMYAKIKGSELSVFPYGFAELYSDNPYTRYDGSEDLATTFAQTEQATQLGFSLVEVTYADTPTFDSKTQNVVYADKPNLISGGWVVSASVVNKSAEEIAAEEASAWARLRADRKSKLSACDWTQLPDAPLTNVQTAAWADYRQALRDLPANTTDPFNPVWPQEPGA